jgi:hypothetical protein
MAKFVQQIPLSDKVRVALVMGGGKIKPVWFEQTDKPGRERIQIKEVTSIWGYSEGAAKILCFAVWDGANCYKLELNTKDFTWRLSVADSQPC